MQAQIETPSAPMRFLPFTLVLLWAVGPSYAGGPTFGDLAVFLAKNYFGSYVRQEAPLEECVALLNSKGVCFSLFDLLDPGKTATEEDVARVMAQSALLFSGDADVEGGCIKNSSKSETWVDYCLLNDIDFFAFWGRLVRRTAEGSLPEVRRFFGDRFGVK